MVGSYCLFSHTSVRNRTPDNWARKLGRSNVFRMSHRLPYYINNVEHGFFLILNPIPDFEQISSFHYR